MAEIIDNESRILALNKIMWIGYPRAQEIRQELDLLLAYPRMHRMPNIALIGETNNGKSMLLKNFVKKHKIEPSPQDTKTILPIIMMDMPPEVDENRFYDILLESVFASGSPREPVTSKFNRLKTLLRKLETKIIILDEFQHSLAGTSSKQRKFLNAIKYVGNSLELSFVASGTIEVLSALQADPQIANRFNPMFLPKWKCNDDYLRLLVTMEKQLGLMKESNLADEKIANLILAAAEGIIGEVRALLVLLAKAAIRSGQEKISVNMFDSKSLRAAGWRCASERSRSP